MAPFWAQAMVAAAPTKKESKTALAVIPKPNTSRNKRDNFKVPSRSHPYILLNPEATKKLYRRFQCRSSCPVGAAVEDYNSGRNQKRSTSQFACLCSRSFVNVCSSARLARPAAGRMGGHVSHAAFVDPDRRENPHGAHAAGEPFLECRS